ncbi:hypothetical protein [Actinoplanes sp. NPDC023714]|uniref:DUF6892 domain-containing protein n=1 Tax=Actinoplanes sp. NPDC023714 TaxID=3154322 RepID=UPI0033FE7A53
MTVAFPSRGLHLGVLDELLTSGAIDAAGLAAIVGPSLGASLDLLHAVPVSSEQAATIESLDFDGGSEIYVSLARLDDPGVLDRLASRGVIIRD